MRGTGSRGRNSGQVAHLAQGAAAGDPGIPQPAPRPQGGGVVQGTAPILAVPHQTSHSNRTAFFEPMEFHLQAPDLLAQLGFSLLGLLQRPAAVSLEEGSTRLHELAFPLADLVGVDACFTRKLRQRLVALDGFQCDLGPEFRTVPGTFPGHRS